MSPISFKIPGPTNSGAIKISLGVTRSNKTGDRRCVYTFENSDGTRLGVQERTDQLPYEKLVVPFISRQELDKRPKNMEWKEINLTANGKDIFPCAVPHLHQLPRKIHYAGQIDTVMEGHDECRIENDLIYAECTRKWHWVPSELIPWDYDAYIYDENCVGCENDKNGIGFDRGIRGIAQAIWFTFSAAFFHTSRKLRRPVSHVLSALWRAFVIVFIIVYVAQLTRNVLISANAISDTMTLSALEKLKIAYNPNFRNVATSFKSAGECRCSSVSKCQEEVKNKFCDAILMDTPMAKQISGTQCDWKVLPTQIGFRNFVILSSTAKMKATVDTFLIDSTDAINSAFVNNFEKNNCGLSNSRDIFSLTTSDMNPLFGTIAFCGFFAFVWHVAVGVYRWLTGEKPRVKHLDEEVLLPPATFQSVLDKEETVSRANAIVDENCQYTVNIDGGANFRVGPLADNLNASVIGTRNNCGVSMGSIVIAVDDEPVVGLRFPEIERRLENGKEVTLNHVPYGKRLTKRPLPFSVVSGSRGKGCYVSYVDRERCPGVEIGDMLTKVGLHPVHDLDFRQVLKILNETSVPFIAFFQKCSVSQNVGQSSITFVKRPFGFDVFPIRSEGGSRWGAKVSGVHSSYMRAQISENMPIVAINGEPVLNQKYQYILTALQSEPLPLTIDFGEEVVVETNDVSVLDASTQDLNSLAYSLGMEAVFNPFDVVIGDAQATEMDDDVPLLQQMEPEMPMQSLRDSWGVGSNVEVFSQSQNEWVPGEIQRIFQDSQGEWLEVKYGGRLKETHRNADDIRPVRL